MSIYHSENYVFKAEGPLDELPTPTQLVVRTAIHELKGVAAADRLRQHFTDPASVIANNSKVVVYGTSEHEEGFMYGLAYVESDISEEGLDSPFTPISIVRMGMWMYPHAEYRAMTRTKDDDETTVIRERHRLNLISGVFSDVAELPEDPHPTFHAPVGVTATRLTRVEPLWVQERDPEWMQRVYVPAHVIELKKIRENLTRKNAWNNEQVFGEGVVDAAIEGVAVQHGQELASAGIEL